MNTQPATILASQVRMVQSEHTGREYRISISLPYCYTKAWPAFLSGTSLAQWPVVYLLDANWFFPMVANITQNMAWCGDTTDAIVVGIGYPESDDPQETWLDAFARRDNDFLPVRDEAWDKEKTEALKHPVQSGDGERFHQFIRSELIPMIEKEFNADPTRRILMGHSNSGFFGAYALLYEPELFDAYVLASPSLRLANGFVFTQEEAYAKEHKVLKAKVHLSAGEREERAVSNVSRFAAVLKSRNYEGLTVTQQVFSDMNHCEVVAPAFHAGLWRALRK